MQQKTNNVATKLQQKLTAMKQQFEEQKKLKIEELRNNPIGTKKDLSNKYWKLPTSFLRETINKIISEARNIELIEAKKVKSITPKEYYMFVKEIEGIELI
ncbi:protein of unknown function [Tenacibaculum sp. 190130A14a]|uniref:Uncharacterized protein n=1 Tax=Tenacibaculum polynesiense TaxID=3137857 RepID=A0ABM9PG27_9FLAO